MVSVARIAALVLALMAGAAPVSAQDWAGPYVGLGISIDAGHVDAQRALDHSMAGVAGEFRAGYLFDAGAFLIGPELMIEPGATYGRADYPNGYWQYRRIDGSASLRLKAALPYDRFLPYVAVGATIASAAYNSSADYEISTGVLGATAAAGIEMDIGDGWSVVGELSLTNYGTVVWLYPVVSPIRQEAQLWTGGLTVGVNYRF